LKRFDIGDLFLAQAKPSGSESGGPPAESGMGDSGKSDGMSEGMTAAKGDGKPAQQGGCMGGGLMGMMLPLVLMFVVFYFFLIRPQQKKQKEHQDLLNQLKKGDQVLTSSGILGRITGITDQWVVLELQEKVRIKILRSHIAGKHADGSPVEPETK
jgi:preprotein translocase subunit YajC